MGGRYAVMWSGGKDCALALTRVRAQGLAVDRLLTFFDPASGRLRFHETPVKLVEAQASAIGVDVQLEAAAWSEFGGRLRAVLAGLSGEGFTGVVFGDVHLADVRAWYEVIVGEAGLEHVEPIWRQPPEKLLREYVAGGGRAVVTCVDLNHLDESWLGRITDPTFVQDILVAGVDPVGENGEYHTFAFAGPPLTAALDYRTGVRRTMDGRFAQLLLEATA